MSIIMYKGEFFSTLNNECTSVIKCNSLFKCTICSVIHFFQGHLSKKIEVLMVPLFCLFHIKSSINIEIYTNSLIMFMHFRQVTNSSTICMLKSEYEYYLGNRQLIVFMSSLTACCLGHKSMKSRQFQLSRRTHPRTLIQ